MACIIEEAFDVDGQERGYLAVLPCKLNVVDEGEASISAGGRRSPTELFEWDQFVLANIEGDALRHNLLEKFA